MQENVTFRPYAPGDQPLCLALFDANCPAFFAANEREDYEQFLEADPAGYEVCLVRGEIVGAFGLSVQSATCQNLSWILFSPEAQGIGLGSQVMNRVTGMARTANLHSVHIAASHLSAPFFARHGATVMREQADGWGPGMHRVDMEWTLPRD